MNKRKTFRIAFSLQREGANIQKVDTINIHWYLTQRAIDLLPALKKLLKSFPPKKGRDFSAFAMEQEMMSSTYLKPNDEAWLTVAKADARPGIHDVGLELTPKKGLPAVEGGATLISALLTAGWQPTTFETIEKRSTEQRKVVLNEAPLETKKIIFKLAFQRQKEAINIPPEVLQMLANAKFARWGFCHVWYNPVILRSINVNFTKMLFGRKWQPCQWEITL